MPLQAVLHLSLSMRALEERTGLMFAVERADLDVFSVAAVVAGRPRYLLRSYHGSPVRGIGVETVETVDAGDPGQQARRFVDHLGVADEVAMWWDGAQWQEGRLPAGVA